MSGQDDLSDIAAKLEELKDEDHLARRRAESEKVVAQFTTEHYKALRILAKHNKYFLGIDVLGYNKLRSTLHADLSKWMRDTDKDPFRLCLLPRGHLKTTLFTKTDAISCALPDDAGTAPWPECLGTGNRIMIGHETDKMASRILSEITDQFLSNTLLMGLFPECIPSPKKQRINLSELDLPRGAKWQEPTFDTMGVGARAQGRHYTKVKLDDIIGKEARDSKTIMESTNEWLDNIQSFFISLTEGELDVTGTRWAHGDTYQHFMDDYGDKLKKYIRAAIERNALGEEVPIFPESFTMESFELIKKKPAIWSAQYANDPSLIDSDFLPSWVRFYNRRGPNEIIVFNRQHGSDIIQVKQYKITDMDVVILIDPALGKSGSGLTGLVVTGMTADENIFTLEAFKRALRPPELIELIFKLVSKYRPRTVAIEEVLFSEVYRHWLQSEMKHRGIRFHITPYSLRGRAKDIRIKGLSNFYAAGRIYHAQDQEDIIAEFKTLGASVENKHILDALSQGPEVWVKPWPQSKRDEISQAEQQQYTGRDANTGY